jgi:hypothetical protein
MGALQDQLCHLPHIVDIYYTNLKITNILLTKINGPKIQIYLIDNKMALKFWLYSQLFVANARMKVGAIDLVLKPTSHSCSLVTNT